MNYFEQHLLPEERNTGRMTAQHLPHLMMAGSKQVIWPGSMRTDLFISLDGSRI